MLISNWWKVLRYSWSIRLIVFAGLCSGAEIALPIIQQFVMIPAFLFLGLSILFTALATVARLLAQRSISGGKQE